MKLSAIIITKNSGFTIEKCLKSLSFVDEIIVLDSGSTDDTVTLCRQHTDQVYQTDWPGFGPQKNRALNKATGDWIFSIDSDEWVSDSLRISILETLKNTTGSVFKLQRRNQYCGQWIRFGDPGKDFIVRLFKKGCARFSDDCVHERVITDEKIYTLKGLLMHNSYRSYEELLNRMNRYTTLSAQQRFSQGKRSSFSRALFSGLWAFLRSYIFRLGFLDGKIGYIVAVSSGQSSFYRHLKLTHLRHRHLL